MEGSTADGDDQTFKCRWEIEDIVHIRSHWYDLVSPLFQYYMYCFAVLIVRLQIAATTLDSVQLEMAKIHVLTKDTIEIETVECTSGYCNRTSINFILCVLDYL